MLKRESGRLLRAIPLDVERVGDLAADDHSVWLCDGRSARITQLDNLTGSHIDTIRTSGPVTGVTFDGECLWYIDLAERRFISVDPHHPQHERQASLVIPKEIVTPTGLAFDGKWLWVTDPVYGRLIATDRVVGSIREAVEIDGHVSGVTFTPHQLIFSETADERIGLVAPHTGQQTTYHEVPGLPVGLHWQAGALWYADAQLNQACLISLRS